jgi:flagellar motor switch protein FliN/FliY
LSPEQLDTLAEIGNIAMGAAATTLSQLLQESVRITTPRVVVTTAGETREIFDVPVVLIRVQYSKGLIGSNVLILTSHDAGVIANIMMGEAERPVPESLDELYLSAVSEAMNQMISSSATALSEMFARTIDVTPPELKSTKPGERPQVIAAEDDETQVVRISFTLEISGVLSSEMVQLLPMDFAIQAVSELQRGMEQMLEQAAPKESCLEACERDTISEIGNISMGSAATALSTLLDKRVSITTPRVSITTAQNVKNQFSLPCVVVTVHYLTGLSGKNVLIIRERDASIIANLMMGDVGLPEKHELDEISLSAVSEAMNQMMGSSATALSDLFIRPVDISPPETVYKDLGNQGATIDGYTGDEQLVEISFHMVVEDLIDSDLIQLIPIEFARETAKELMSAINTSDVYVPEEAPVDIVEPASAAEPEPVPDMPLPDFSPQSEQQEGFIAGTTDTIQLELIRDIPVRVRGLLGRRKLFLKELNRITPGSVIELDSLVDAPIELLANGRLVALGEVVRVNENFGVKITKIIHSWQRDERGGKI